MPSSPNDSALPDWAVAQADASLKVGQSVPEIERRLVAKGLSAATATAVVNRILEGRVRAGQAPAERGGGPRAAHQAASAVVGCVCLVLAYAFGGGLSAARTFTWLLLPVACIWYPEVVERTVPPALLRGVAWLVVLVIAGYRVVLLAYADV